MTSECEVCKGFVLRPGGLKDSPILLVANEPHWESLKAGLLWSKDKAGDLLRKEFARVGMNLRECRTMNLWMHREVTPSQDAYEDELKFHDRRLQEEMKGRKAVLLFGRQPVMRVLDEKISNVETMNIIQGDYLPKSVEVCVTCRHPSVALRKEGVVGNVRFAIERFAQLTKELR